MRIYDLRQGTERGMALLTSLLLLLVITLMALAMFRSFGTQEKIAGNLREKDRALHAASSAQQYGEWWLLQGNNTAVGAVACAAGTWNANAGEGQICNAPLSLDPTLIVPTPTLWPFQIQYKPTDMGVGGTLGTNNDLSYAGTPAFYIWDIGPAADAAGEVYQVNAFGYGQSISTVAVVESVYEVQQGVVNRGGL